MFIKLQYGKCSRKYNTIVPWILSGFKVDQFPILGDVHSLIPPFVKGILIAGPLRELRVSHLPMEIMGVFNRPMSCLPKKTKLNKQLADRK